MNVFKDSGVRLPVRIRDGAPVCEHCDAAMVQVEAPSESFPGGTWQCPVSAAELEDIRRMLAEALDRML